MVKYRPTVINNLCNEYYLTGLIISPKVHISLFYKR